MRLVQEFPDRLTAQFSNPMCRTGWPFGDADATGKNCEPSDDEAALLNALLGVPSI
jgi:hypothetical protein